MPGDRYAELAWGRSLVKATTVSSVRFALYLWATGDLPGVPRSVLIIDCGIALTLFGGIRFRVRWSRERGLGQSWEFGGRRTLIIGTGDAAAHLLHQLLQQPEPEGPETARRHIRT